MCSHAIFVIDLGLEHVNHQVLLGVSVGELVLTLVVTSVRLDDHSREASLVLIDGSSMVLYSTVYTVQYIGFRGSPGTSF